MYKPVGSIYDALKNIQAKQWVLPAIQREFVWKPEQIERLFDSLMQGYPFGTFLFWKVEPDTSGTFKFYDFVQNYHQRDAAHCPELGVLHRQSLVAVLDGQQRLTSLNIGLRGSMSMKQPNKWWNNPDAFPKMVLHLDLLAEINPDEDGVKYRFKFLTKDQVTKSGSDSLWYPVPNILSIEDTSEIGDFLIDQPITDNAARKRANQALHRLFNVIRVEPNISCYEESAQDLERVLNIFIRLNSGGTPLSYSDLLLSVAVAQWKNIDARAEIHQLVDEINRIGAGFTLSQDFVLKAGLMLANIASVGFKVENFTAQNMATLESDWQAIRTALVRTVELAASFGLSGQNLRADSALLPIACYLHKRGAPSNFITHSSHASDRETIRKWIIRSLLKASGIWGSGLDTLLTELRSIIQAEGDAGFPISEIENAMNRRGKSLSFTLDEIDELTRMSYSDKRAFALLSLLYDFVDLRNNFHIDHVYPMSRFSNAKMRKDGIDESKHEMLRSLANSAINLQLLDGHENNEKRAKMPLDWVQSVFVTAEKQAAYYSKHDIDGLTNSLTDFEVFADNRRGKMKDRLSKLLNE